MLLLGPIRSVIYFTDPCGDHCIVYSFSFTLKAALQQSMIYRAFYYYLREFQPVLTHQYVTLYDYLLFFHLAHKTKIGTAKRWETTKSKPLRPITSVNQKFRAAIRSYLLLFSGRCYTSLHLLSASANSAKMVHWNHFAELNQHILQGHWNLHRSHWWRLLYTDIGNFYSILAHFMSNLLT
jgi:hypothetical protein